MCVCMYMCVCVCACACACACVCVCVYCGVLYSGLLLTPPTDSTAQSCHWDLCAGQCTCILHVVVLETGYRRMCTVCQ